MVSTLYNYMYFGLIIALGILIFFAILKSIIGPKTADRIVAVNMASTMIVIIICVLTAKYKSEGYLADVAIIYVLISFVAVVVLANVFINVNMRHKFVEEDNDAKEEN